MSKPEKKKQSSKKKSDKATKSDEGPWYRDGLAFECTQCGQCCSGEPGYVWVNEEEIQAMANEMGLEQPVFESKYIRQVGRDRSLMEYDDGDCILLDRETRKCSVYQARPIQCRTWPFWDSTVLKKKTWKETCEVCPGAGKGRVYTFEEIESQRLKKSV
ncbi:YkgJ family cysteine cluster protein [Planctomycetes bacterium K23_9]|uniref:Flagellin N-methylase n=1 Tax=Stieleria marina TaxID=1930275 RepID=A0A517NWT6_9BACT|nr:Flagellin N-methylase [Planctomycetes bacterium K23_9]